MRPLQLLWLAPVLLLLAGPHQALAQGCGIGVSPQPSTVNFPFDSLPSGGVTFAETFNVNYPAAFANQTLTLQYLNGSAWLTLQSFAANSVGFTEVDKGLDRGWAKFGTNQVRVAGASCTSPEATFSVLADTNAVVVDAAIYATVAVLVLAFFVLGRRLGWKRFALLAAAVYLALSPFTGQRYDIYFLLSSGVRILQHVDPFNPGSPPVYPGPLKWAYPPLYAVYSALSFVVYQLVTGSPLPSVASLTYPGWLTSTYSVYQAFVPPTLPVLVALLKLPMIISALVTGVLLKRMTGDESAAVWWVANPLVILVAAVWGQLDPIATVLAVASLYAFQRRKLGEAYLLSSLGAAVKAWPVLLIPLFFVVSFRREGPKAVRPLAATIPAFLLTVGLYAAYGNPVQSLFLFAYARGIPTFAGAFSVNGLTWQELLFVLKSPPIPVFLIVGIPAYLGILAWIYRKRDGDVAKWLVVSILVFYLTYNYVNPQYFYWIVPFLILQRKKVAALVFTALPLVFMAFAYDIFYFASPGVLPNEYALGASVADQLKVNLFYQSPVLLVVLAGSVPTAAYAALLYRELKSGGGSAAPQSPGPSQAPVTVNPGEIMDKAN